MQNWKTILILPSTSIIKAMEIIDKSKLQFAVVVDNEGHLLGTVTDGDIRRGILRGLSLNEPINCVMNPFPIFEYEGKENRFYHEILLNKKLKQLPIVDTNRKVVQIIFSDEIKKNSQKENIVVLMAGGLGTRLRPLTNEVPKPMLSIGDRPILETIIEGFKSYGFTNFVLSVNYKKEIIKDYFQDGRYHGVNISYIIEEKRLGTAGALSLLYDHPKHPFIVMNGDLLTKINYNNLLEFHLKNNSLGTMCIREYEYQIPYGVIETNNHRILSIEEKPIHRYFANAGVYVLNPEVINYIPNDSFFDMPDLFKKLLSDKKGVTAFPLREYWMDIGKMEEFKKANDDFFRIFV